MNRSLNEIEAQAKRAARGAGLSWGMAEEAARATRWLASHHLSGAALLADVLTKNDGMAHAQVAPVSLDGDWRVPSGHLCPLAVGATLNDCADQLSQSGPITAADVSYPLLVLPFAAWAAIHLGQPVRMTFVDVQIDTDGVGLWLDAAPGAITAAQADTVTIQMAPPRSDPAQQPGPRGDVTSDVWARLDAFAQRTFAPATEASRRLGAGADLSDTA